LFAESAFFTASSSSMAPSWTRSISAMSKVCMPYGTTPFSMTSLIEGLLAGLRMLSRAVPLAMRTSAHSTSPEPSRLGIRRCAMTPCMASASRSRISSGFLESAIMRLTVRDASGVCIVDSTRWPVSAACIAISSVSPSRISPTRMTSGSWRSAARSASLYVLVSLPTSR
jgi:hypothetical protein